MTRWRIQLACCCGSLCQTAAGGDTFVCVQTWRARKQQGTAGCFCEGWTCGRSGSYSVLSYCVWSPAFSLLTECWRLSLAGPLDSDSTGSRQFGESERRYLAQQSTAMQGSRRSNITFFSTHQHNGASHQRKHQQHRHLTSVAALGFVLVVLIGIHPFPLLHAQQNRLHSYR